MSLFIFAEAVVFKKAKIIKAWKRNKALLMIMTVVLIECRWHSDRSIIEKKTDKLP